MKKQLWVSSSSAECAVKSKLPFALFLFPKCGLFILCVCVDQILHFFKTPTQQWEWDEMREEKRREREGKVQKKLTLHPSNFCTFLVPFLSFSHPLFPSIAEWSKSIHTHMPCFIVSLSFFFWEAPPPPQLALLLLLLLLLLFSFLLFFSQETN